MKKQAHPLGPRTLRLVAECTEVLVDVARVMRRVRVGPRDKREREMEEAFVGLIDRLADAALGMSERPKPKKKR